ncbi:fibronectin type III domain-containing protein [Jatrophihabitans telluris]|uniref:Fibronectin type III domain-containing protein n=1 Tax=Jatrophihabitans telluris TaxID=2038343 RepID=A0ABY4R1B2_9ACTN|nr:fibronectin type III domain-containing protein [Jatrophihabitans telluris]UQX89097.1 fibronectin type III domain-containing protein [Jatrophihabitans telluris]
MRRRSIPNPLRYLGTRPVLAVLASTLAVVGAIAAVGPSASAASIHDPFGHVDVVEYRNGALHIKGWAEDRDSTHSVYVHLKVNGKDIVVLANQPRADVGKAYPALGPNRGFDFVQQRNNGTFPICATFSNRGPGRSLALGCRYFTVDNNPRIGLTTVTRIPGGLLVGGWAVDPNATGPVDVTLNVDSVQKTLSAATPSVAVPSSYLPFYGKAHGFLAGMASAAGTRQVCMSAANLGAGSGPTAFCQTVTISADPAGSLASVTRTSDTAMSVSGWALDPDTARSSTVQITVDGVALGSPFPAAAASAVATTAYPQYAANGHGFTKTLAVDGGEHTVCAIGVNYANTAGQNSTLGCTVLYAAHPVAPAQPATVSVWPGNTTVAVSWTAPTLDGGAPVTGYVVTSTPATKTVTLAGSATQTTISGLKNGTNYTFSVSAVNLAGTGAVRTSAAVAPTPIPPQVTPAPVSTSHYLRNLTGNLSNDAALMKAMGAKDAGYNPSGHRYVVLLQIGGQDMSRGGVLLSATSKFVTNAAVVNAMNAYLAGYASKQKAYAPMLLAIGTNNDVDVSSSAGAVWANRVVNPVRSYAARFPGISVGGANDIEPGFSATAAESKSWLSGYLANTSASFVFNGSADGCSTITYNSRCNNGWSMSALQWLGGGAAPSRTINLPQIYNTAMPLQWKYISYTGVKAGKSKLYFGGPLTEVTACDQVGSCGSLANTVAWQRLWSALSSSAATRQSTMPHGTDLRIN